MQTTSRSAGPAETAGRHVVLVTYGEPPDPRFLSHLAYSWRILVGLTRTIADIPRPLLPVIALARARSRHRSWTDERYGSPLESITQRQTGMLRAALSTADGDGKRWEVRTAYEFRRPLLPEVLDGLPADEDVTIVPMYATDSAFTHALSRGQVEQLSSIGRAGSNGKAGRKVAVLGQLDTEVLARASADHVLERTREGWQGRDVAVVLAAHGTLLEPSRPIETGLRATEDLATAIERRLAPRFGMTIHGWLNHVRGGRWTEPPIDGALRQVVEAGFRRVVYFPYGFLADNAESQLEGRAALRAQQSVESLHLPCLNDSPRLIEALAAQILD